jgi:hypothetical protein
VTTTTITTITTMEITMTDVRNTTAAPRPAPSPPPAYWSSAAVSAARATRIGQMRAREARARRALFAGCLAGFAALLGLVAATAPPAQSAAPEPAPVSEVAVGSGRVVAQVPVTGLDGAGVPTIIRIIAPDQPPSLPHVRTRAS